MRAPPQRPVISGRSSRRAWLTHYAHTCTMNPEFGIYAVTLSQVAIALAAMAILTRRRLLWFGSLGLGALGAFFLVQGLL